VADHELYAALQADLVDELRREAARLRLALTEAVLDRAGFQRQPDGSYLREAGLGSWLFVMPISPDDARHRLAAHGIHLGFVEVPAS
jgi:hypothetical protein